MATEPGQELPKSPAKLAEEAQSREAKAGASTGTAELTAPREHLSPEARSPFSPPPAPPPQQPLPAKPDSLRLANGNGPVRPLLRSTTEKPLSPSLLQQDNELQHGQVMSLMDALKAAAEQSDSQGHRIRHLESALKRERRAREAAERRVHALSGEEIYSSHDSEDGLDDEDGLEAPLDTVDLLQHDLPNGHFYTDDDERSLRSSASAETLTNPSNLKAAAGDSEHPTSRVQAQLELMHQEMDEMKTMMETYKRRAEDAEEGRRSLAEMIENIRAGRDPHFIAIDSSRQTTALTKNANGSAAAPTNDDGGNASRGLWPSNTKVPLMNGHASPSHSDMEASFVGLLQKQDRWSGEPGRMAQSTPYVSIVGVVIIGVGLMTWLNRWQPGGER